MERPLRTDNNGDRDNSCLKAISWWSSHFYQLENAITRYHYKSLRELDRRTRHYFNLINFDFLQCTSFLVSNHFNPLHFLFLKPVHHIKAYTTSGSRTSERGGQIFAEIFSRLFLDVSRKNF